MIIVRACSMTPDDFRRLGNNLLPAHRGDKPRHSDGSGSAFPDGTAPPIRTFRRLNPPGDFRPAA